jgi:hypothetical protein
MKEGFKCKIGGSIAPLKDPNVKNNAGSRLTSMDIR